MKKLLLLITIVTIAGLGAFAQPAGTSNSTTSTAKSTAFRATKDQIKEGQKILIGMSLWKGEATGVYGNSRDAIKEYQKKNSLDVTGKFDRPTLEKMGIALTDKQKGIVTTTTASTGKSVKQIAAGGQDTAGVKRPAPFQATPDQIKLLQQRLKDAKLFAGEADGKRSDTLKASVKSYQEANGLTSTGGINAATLEKAGIPLTDKQKEQVAAQAAYDASKKPQ